MVVMVMVMVVMVMVVVVVIIGVVEECDRELACVCVSQCVSACVCICRGHRVRDERWCSHAHLRQASRILDVNVEEAFA